MKNWICYNLFGENPENVDTVGMIGGLVVMGVPVVSGVYLFVYIPLVYFW